MMKSPDTAETIPINPRLASALGIEWTEHDGLTIPLSALPSEYADRVRQKRENVPNDYPENKQWLTCGECGRREKYDLGLIAVDPNWVQELILLTTEGKDERLRKLKQDIKNHVQLTGYFRCVGCNGGGKWSFDDGFADFVFAAIVIQGASGGPRDSIQVGPFQMFDGYQSKSGADSEEHLLNALATHPDDGFLWNRLGNVYSRGGAAELAVVAFERSVQHDISQVESHASLVSILYQIGEFDACIRHSHFALAHARYYRMLEHADLHLMISVLLRNLLAASMALDNTNLFVPPRELIMDAVAQHGKPLGQPSESLDWKTYDLYLDDIGSFADLADVYLGSSGKSHKRQSTPRHHRKKKNGKR